MRRRRHQRLFQGGFFRAYPHRTPLLYFFKHLFTTQEEAPDVNTWDIVMAALARMKPARDRRWLQDKLGVKAQALTNWKAAGEVPAGRYMEICDLVGLTAEQLTGRAPLPWADEGWPFQSISQVEFRNLSAENRQEIENRLREMVEGLRPKKENPSGGSSTSRRKEHARYGT